MDAEKEKKDVSRRQFIGKGVKGALVVAYVAPVILTVSLNRPAEAGDDGKGKGGDVSEVGGGKGKGKGD